MKVFMRKQGMASASALGFVLLAALSCGGCGTTGVEASGKKIWTQEGAPDLSRQIVINNASLARSVEIVDMKSGMVGSLMKAQVSLRSKQYGTLPMQYRFDWFDGQGMQIAANSSWNPLIVYGGESKTVQGVAPDPRAKEFKLKLREAE